MSAIIGSSPPPVLNFVYQDSPFRLSGSPFTDMDGEEWKAMVRRVLFVVDGSVPSHQAAELAYGLLPKAAEVLVLQVVPQLPRVWIVWPAFPDPEQDLAIASAYISEVSDDLETQGWNVRTRVDLSPLSAAEMDQEILKVAETFRPDLIYLALAKGGVTGSIVRKAAMPVLVAKPPSHSGDASGRRDRSREYLEPALVPHALLLNPGAIYG